MRFERLRHLLFCDAKAQDRKLLDQFFVTLDGTFKQLVCTGQSDACSDDIVTLLGGEQSWRAAYHIEQLMVPLFAGANLDVELQRRMGEIGKLDPIVTGTYESLLVDADESQKRACLGRLINDLQWRYEQRNLRRVYAHSVIARTSALFTSAIFLFFVFDFLLDPEIIKSASRSFVIYTAISSGIFGATFSMLVTMRRRVAASTLDELRSAQRWMFLVSRAFIGAGAGLVLLYFIESGLLQADLLPDIADAIAFTRGDSLDGDQRANMALLILWCFISGFSENLVPNILARTETQIDNQPPRPTA